MLFFSILPSTINEQYLLSRLDNVNRQGNAFLVGGNIQICLVEAQRLYDVGVFMEYLVNLLRNLLVPLIMTLHDNQVGTQAVCS